MGLLDQGIVDTATATLGEFAAPFKQFFQLNPTWVGPDFPDGFIIREINTNDPSGVTDTVLALLGEWAPHQPFQWGGKQRLVKEYYPGNPEPTVQVLGSTESQLKITGRFKVKHLRTWGEPDLDSQYREIPSMLCDALDEMRQRGNLLKLTLGEWERYAFLEETDWKMRTLADIDYEITFFIIGEDEPSQCKLADESLDLPTDLNNALITNAAILEALGTQPFTGINLGLFAQISAAISAVATGLKLVTTFVDTAFSIQADVQKLSSQALGLIKYAQSKIVQYKIQVGALNPYVGSDPATASTWDEAKNANSAVYVTKCLTATVLPPSISPAQLAAAQAKVSAYTPTASTRATAAAQTHGQSIDQILVAMFQKFTKLAQTYPLARYLVKSGDILEKISVKYYGTPDNWKKIFDHNSLSSTVLTPGVTLEIPKL